MLINAGYKVVYPTGGANFISGHILMLLKCVNIFNKVKVDACILECDELNIVKSLKPVNPQYLIVTNSIKVYIQFV